MASVDGQKEQNKTIELGMNRQCNRIVIYQQREEARLYPCFLLLEASENAVAGHTIDGVRLFHILLIFGGHLIACQM
jgi:hypothetical protein